jgi:hypothetical protein
MIRGRTGKRKLKFVKSGARAVAILSAIMALGPRASVAQQLADVLRVSTQGLFFNARALGMGNAYSTIGYDFSALHFNPATMSVNDRGGYTMSIAADGFKSSSDYYGGKVNFMTTNTAGTQAGLTIPFRLDSVRSLIVGAGYTQSKDFNVGFKYEGLNGGSESFISALAFTESPAARDLGLTYPTYDSSGNFVADATILGTGLYETGYLLNEGGMYYIPFGLSVQAVRNIFVGVSGSYNVGRLTSDLELKATDPYDAYPDGVQAVPGDPRTDGFVGTSYRIVRSKEYKGWDARFGVLYKLENFIGVSASFRMPGANTVDDQVFVSGRTQFGGNTSLEVPETSSVSSYSFQPPSEITVGAMVNLWILTGTAEARYVDYSQVKLTSGAGDLPDRTKVNKQIKDELGAVVNLNMGAEFRLPFTGLSARAGFIYQPSQYKEDPTRFSQKFLTAGIGLNSGDVMQFDFAYAYGWRGEHKSQKTVDESMAQQTLEYHAVLITMRFSP